MEIFYNLHSLSEYNSTKVLNFGPVTMAQLVVLFVFGSVDWQSCKWWLSS